MPWLFDPHNYATIVISSQGCDCDGPVHECNAQQQLPVKVDLSKDPRVCQICHEPIREGYCRCIIG